MTNFKFNMRGWNELVDNIIDTEGVKRMRRVAAACNRADQADLRGRNEYMVSVEGAKPLRRRSYRATVITAGANAMRANARNNTLVSHFYLAGGS